MTKWITFGLLFGQSALGAAAHVGIVTPELATNIIAVVSGLLGAFHLSPAAAGAISKP